MPNIYGISTEDRVLTSSFFAFRRSSVSFPLIVLPISPFFVHGNLSKQAADKNTVTRKHYSHLYIYLLHVN